jgi:hypothetical protein
MSRDGATIVIEGVLVLCLFATMMAILLTVR